MNVSTDSVVNVLLRHSKLSSIMQKLTNSTALIKTVVSLFLIRNSEKFLEYTTDMIYMTKRSALKSSLIFKKTDWFDGALNLTAIPVSGL